MIECESRWTIVHDDGGERVTAQCRCGTVRRVLRENIKYGKSRSCGCLSRDVARLTHTQHGMYRSPEYRVWEGMIQRCENPNNKRFADYGGRGIKVCARWRDSFVAFYQDMGPRPPGLTIDREDNDGDYEPGNCRWITNEQQHQNRRNNVRVAWEGRTLTVAEWADELGMKYATLSCRLRRGWSIRRAMTRPVSSPQRIDGQFISGEGVQRADGGAL